MQRILQAIALGAIALTGVSCDAEAEPTNPGCMDRATLLKDLSDRYEEAPIGLGVQADGALVELIKSETGTWTILVTRYVNGAACTTIGSVGKGWHVLPAASTDPLA